MSEGRIHYLAGALWIGLGTLSLLTLITILPGAPSWPTLGYVFYALGVGMIPLGIYYVLTIKRKRGLVGAA